MGKQTIYFRNKPQIISVSTVAGTKECEGIIGRYVENALSDDMYGESTYEKAECKMLRSVIDGAIANAELKRSDIDAIVSGDLLNQIISASFAARDLAVPFLGVYGACSTMAESLAVAAAFVDGGFCNRVVAATGSHFASAERQYRYPLELGTTRPPQSQWTVTGAGATVPISGFGYLLANGAMRGAQEGLFQALTGSLAAASAGVTAAVIFSFIMALIFKSHTKHS